ncbi:hypothetical protein M728_005490 (plasmid) [Ensifer sp. WSM1721]
MQIASSFGRTASRSASTNAALAVARPSIIHGIRVPVLTRKPGALRNGAPFHDWVLPAAIEKVRRRLKAMHDGDRQMVSILECVGLDGLPTVEAACQEALDQGVFSAAVIINILAPKRDPQPAAIPFHSRRASPDP